jgi:hypothetical protein
VAFLTTSIMLVGFLISVGDRLYASKTDLEIIKVQVLEINKKLDTIHIRLDATNQLMVKLIENKEEKTGRK